MIALRTQIEQSGVLASRGVTKREMTRIMKKLLHFVAAYWHRTYLRSHFDTQTLVMARYPGAIEKRTARYMKRKARTKRHQRNLVWSGDMMADVTGPPRITGTSAKAEIHFRWRTKRSKDFSIRARRELGVINETEWNDMTRRAGEAFPAELDHVRATNRFIVDQRAQARIEAGIERLQEWMAA